MALSSVAGHGETGSNSSNTKLSSEDSMSPSISAFLLSAVDNAVEVVHINHNTCRQL